MAAKQEFFSTPPAAPLTVNHIDWRSTAIPEYNGRLACTIDGVLTPSECEKLLKLAEASVQADEPWQPALIGLTPGTQIVSRPGYRESDRIIWCDQAVTNKIWARCMSVDGLEALFATVPQQYGKVRQGEWRFERPNERMSFLRYGPGQYFKPHCDGPYYYDADDTEYQTHYTLQLYLCESREDAPDGVLGGATSFLAKDKKRRVDVHPKAGRVLIFQHEGLLHEGAEVREGIKYTMRTDVLYKWIRDQ